jgi:hypothetical protein
MVILQPAGQTQDRDHAEHGSYRQRPADRPPHLPIRGPLLAVTAAASVILLKQVRQRS